MLNECKKIHPKKKYRFLELISKKSFFKLLIYYIIIQLATIALFSFVYSFFELSQPNSNGKPESNYLSLLYFSTTTHFTIGYGDLTPKTCSFLFIAIHSLIYSITTSIFLGILLLKMLWPKEIIIISRYMTYDPTKEMFSFSIYNSIEIDLINVNVIMKRKKLLEISESPSEGYKWGTKEKLLSTKVIPNMNQHWIFRIKTLNKTSADQDRTKILEINDIDNSTKIQILITGILQGIGGISYAQLASFSISDIRCGKLHQIQTFDASGILTKEQWELFDDYTSTDQEYCYHCISRDNCIIQNKHCKQANHT
jgi:hypothetical protein